MLGLLALVFMLTMSFAMAVGVDPNRNREQKCCDTVSGKIESINAAEKQIVVNDVTIQVTDDTVITKEGTPISFDDLEVGMYVCACGEYEEEILIAKKIKVKVFECDLKGEITSINAAEKQIIVDDVTVQITDDTKIHKKWKILEFEDLEVGMLVCVKGELQGSVLIAKTVSVCGCGGR
jgi:ribosomal protein L24